MAEKTVTQTWLKRMQQEAEGGTAFWEDVNERLLMYVFSDHTQSIDEHTNFYQTLKNAFIINIIFSVCCKQKNKVIYFCLLFNYSFDL